jgi:hypothetical protein
VPPGQDRQSYGLVWLPLLLQNFHAEALGVEIALFVITEMGVPALLGARSQDEKFALG